MQISVRRANSAKVPRGLNSGHRRYKRASTRSGPGEPLCFVSVADYALRRRDAEIARLRHAIQKTLDENGHLADAENCTLIRLKRALETPNAALTGAAQGE